jgi:phage gp36-like protein
MTYCTVDDLLRLYLSNDQLIQLTDDAGTGVVDPDKVDAAIADAQEEIDGYLRGRLGPLPLNPVPALIVSIATAISAYKLYRRRLNLTCPDSCTADYKDAIKKLEKIQEGKITISAQDAARGPGDYKVNKNRRDRMFGQHRLEEY